MSHLKSLLVLISLLALPLVGAYWGFGNLDFLLVFPPEFDRVSHLDFDLKLSLIVLVILSGFPMLWYLAKRRDRIFRHNLVLKRRHFPKWGYFGYIGLGALWLVAWTRYEVLEWLQPYTFTPVWLSFIVVVNAHVHRLSNTAPLYKAPGKFTSLFVVSAVFWWIFEYLNRYSENWVYSGVESVSGMHYFIHGSICFSTVLPAVYSVFRLLSCQNALHKFFFLGPKVSLLKSRQFTFVCLLVGLLGMIGVGAYPSYACPFLWLGPVLLYVGLRNISKRAMGKSSLIRGDWRWVAFWSIAGLICGFFWELWNFRSLLKWEYQVSFFNGLHVFEMPLLGYLGYLPFGVFCGLVTLWVFPNRASIEFSPND